jgi:hypothetical protein
MFRPSLPITVERAKARRVIARNLSRTELTRRLHEAVAQHERAGNFKAAAIFKEILAEREATANGEPEYPR